MPSKSDTAITIFSNDMCSSPIRRISRNRISPPPHHRLLAADSAVEWVASFADLQQLLRLFYRPAAMRHGHDFGDLIIGLKLNLTVGELLGYP